MGIAASGALPKFLKFLPFIIKIHLAAYSYRSSWRILSEWQQTMRNQTAVLVWHGFSLVVLHACWLHGVNSVSEEAEWRDSLETASSVWTNTQDVFALNTSAVHDTLVLGLSDDSRSAADGIEVFQEETAKVHVLNANSSAARGWTTLNTLTVSALLLFCVGLVVAVARKSGASEAEGGEGKLAEKTAEGRTVGEEDTRDDTAFGESRVSQIRERLEKVRELLPVAERLAKAVGPVDGPRLLIRLRECVMVEETAEAGGMVRTDEN